MADALMAIGLLLQVVVAVLNVRNARKNRRDAERLAHGVTVDRHQTFCDQPPMGESKPE